MTWRGRLCGRSGRGRWHDSHSLSVPGESMHLVRRSSPVVRFVLLVVLVALTPLLNSGRALAADAGPRASQDRIDAYVQERMAAWSVPGLSLAIVEDGKV